MNDASGCPVDEQRNTVVVADHDTLICMSMVSGQMDNTLLFALTQAAHACVHARPGNSNFTNVFVMSSFVLNEYGACGLNQHDSVV